MNIKMLLPVVLLGFSAALQAEGAKDIQPGLWEITHKTAVDGQKMPDMSEMMASVPPEMRAQVEAMMAKKGAGVSSKGVTICITAEQIDKQEYGKDPESDCQVTDINHESNVTRMKMTCTKPKGEGETTITRQSDKAWVSVSSMRIEQDGETHTMETESSARWLADDCGGVNPSGQ